MPESSLPERISFPTFPTFVAFQKDSWQEQTEALFTQGVRTSSRIG